MRVWISIHAAHAGCDSLGVLRSTVTDPFQSTQPMRAATEFGWDIVGVIKNLGSLSGQYKTHDGLLLQWGTVSITPTAAGTPTSAIVTYPQPFTTNPLVYVTPVTSVPQNVSLGVLRSTVTDQKLQQEIVLTRDGTTSTVINWLAIGKGAA